MPKAKSRPGAQFAYVGIRVKDINESVAFYTKVLGMVERGRSRIDAASGDVAVLEPAGGGFQLELNHYDGGSEFDVDYVVGEGLDHLAFGVSDLDAAIRAAKRAGYRFLKEVKTEKSRWAYVEDPNGIWIELFKA